MSESDYDRVWEIMDDIAVCMVTTHAGGKMRSRPMGDNTYLSVTGTAEMIRDPAKAEDLWSTEAQVWWPRGPNDPSVRVLRVVPEQAEYWDTRGNPITVALKLIAARVSGREPNLGENRKVTIR